MAYIINDDTSSLQSTFLASDDTVDCSQTTNVFVKRNLASEMYRIADENVSVLLPPPSSMKETVNVYLRIKPKTSEELEFYSCRDDSELGKLDEDQLEVVKIESRFQIALNAPKDSNTYKNSVNGAGALCHRFVFNKIFPPETRQEELFMEMVKPKLVDFLEGQNQLLFTYGATSSGKTFTIQGDAERPGIIPRALDSIFNSVGLRLVGEPIVKPSGFKGVEKLEGETLRKVYEEKVAVLNLGKELTNAFNGTDISTKSSTASMLSDASQNYSHTSQQSLATMFPQFINRLRETLTLTLPSSNEFLYSVWVSYAEIYNENIYDLLEKMPEAKRKGEKPRRVPLKLAEESGCVYIKGLKEICVSSADEAYQLMMIGSENLQFAATRLNHNSSRSHCIFTIKVIKLVDHPQMHFARVSMLSFCDLAGSERIKKTQNTGDRQKEAGNINSSLLVLGRCIKAIRHNQLVKDTKKHQLVPYRDSKMTRLFQSFFNGRGLGKASMIVNVSQSPYLFDESLQVLKFAAIASKVNIEIKVDNQGPGLKDSKKRRQSQFSMIVMDKKSRDSLLNGRGSIAWEKPMSRSTMCPVAQISQSTISEEDETEMESSCVATFNHLDETATERAKYAEFLDIIDQLKNELVKEKQNSAKQAEEIRRELNMAYDKMIVGIEQRWGERLQGEKDRMTELSEWRIQTLQDALKEEQIKKRKRRREDDDGEADNSDTLRTKLQNVEEKLQDREIEYQQLEKESSAMKSAVSALMNEKHKYQEEITKKSFEISSTRMELEQLESKVKKLEDQLKASNEAFEQQSSDPKVKDLEREVTNLTKVISKLEEEKRSMKTLLDEAGKDFLEKTEEVVFLESEVQKAQAMSAEMRLNMRDLESQSEEYRLMLSNANFLIDEKDSAINDYEEKIRLLEDKLENLENANKWADKKSVEQQLSALNDEIESLTKDKKKLRSLLDAKITESQGKESEVSKLKSDLEKAQESEKLQHEQCKEIQAELEIMKNQAKDLSLKISEVDMLSRSLKDKQATIEQLQTTLDSEKREGKALDAIKSDLSLKSKENSELGEKVQTLTNQVSVLEYDLAKIKTERVELMEHYSERFKKLNDELMLEKSEAEKLKNALSTATVSSQDTSKQQEWKEEALKLRKELKQKSELIQTLTERIAPVNEKIDVDEIIEERDRLSKEVEVLKSSHATEILKAKKSFEKIISEYKDTNASLIKNIGGFADDKPNIFNDSIEENSAPRPSRGSRVSATTQVSFQDSPVENVHPDDTRGSKTSPPRRISKRGTRVSGTRPTRSRARPRATCSFTDEDDDNGQLSCPRRSRKGSSSSLPPTLEDGESFRPLKELQFALSPLTESPSGSSPILNGAQTRGRKKLFRDSRIPEPFTPPEINFGSQSARSIVQRELRSKRIKKN